MTKASLRKIYLEKRKHLTPAEVAFLSAKIFQNFIHRFDLTKDSKVHTFQSISKFNEVDTSLLIQHLFEIGARVFVPKMSGAELLAIEITADSEMALNSWGIPEPISNDDAAVQHYNYVITPLLYCDRQGNRVGYGKGFYDGFFAGVSPESQKVGVGFFAPEGPVEDLNPLDVALDHLVTPDEVLSFGSL